MGDVGPTEAKATSSSETEPRTATSSRRRPFPGGAAAVLEFSDRYQLVGETLGRGSYARVEACRRRSGPRPPTSTPASPGDDDPMFAVKIIDKAWPGLQYHRSRVLKEIETFSICRGHEHILQLLEYFEEDTNFKLVFEKIEGGPLLGHIRARNRPFTEHEASVIMENLGRAVEFLHSKGIAHRDIKPENVLCVRLDSPFPVKLCDFDLCSVRQPANYCRAPLSSSSAFSGTGSRLGQLGSHHSTTPKLQTPVGSLEYMAPEVLKTFQYEDDLLILQDDDEDEEEDVEDDDCLLTYDKKCDLWSLGVILYILLCGRPPFSGNCGQDCGWDKDEPCRECHAKLFFAIRSGEVDLGGDDWQGISEEAKDLVSGLLERNTCRRLDARSLLKHKWVVSKGIFDDASQSRPLSTPSELRKWSEPSEPSSWAKATMPSKCPMSQLVSSAISLHWTLGLKKGGGGPSLHTTCSFDEAVDDRGWDREDDGPSSIWSSGRTKLLLQRQHNRLERHLIKQPPRFSSIDENSCSSNFERI